MVQRRVPGVVVLGGDVHANYVADLKPGNYAAWDDARTPTVATEFCGTSISSLGLAQTQVDQARVLNPHLRHARSEQRGYMRFTLERTQLQADLREVADARDPASAVSSQGRFVVDQGKPGAQLA